MRAKIYLWLHTWALRHYRKVAKVPGYKNYDPELTFHALLRYLERFKDMDVKRLRDEIVTPEVHRMINEIGGEGQFESGGIQYIIRGGKIISVYPHSVLRPVRESTTPDGVTKKWSF